MWDGFPDTVFPGDLGTCAGARLSRASLVSTATKQSSGFRFMQNLVVSLSSQTLGVRTRTASGLRV